MVVAGAGTLPARVAADLPEPGPNGRIAFTSGREDGTLPALDNNVAQIWLLNSPGGSATRFTSQIFQTSHHRHPSWSPDHTKIVYARGPDDDNFNGPWSIVVHDVALGSSIVIASASNVQDRPAWSPDGTRIAYQRDLDNADATANWVVETRPATGGSPTTVATGVDTGPSSQYTRPHWTPDSQAILYGKLVAANDHDIYRAPADGSNPAGTAVVTGGTNDYQPHVSPAGTKICFTRDSGDKDVITATINGGSQQILAVGAGLDYECAWSPDTTKILFTRGAFGAGQLLMRNSDASGTVTTVTDAANPAFDGNGDWAVNFRPTCQDGAANVAFNGFVEIPLSCTDSEGQGVSREIVTPPAGGVLGAISNTDTVIYTPNVNFQGADSFTFKGNDGTSDSNTATINVTVNGPAAGGGGGGGVAGAPVVEAVNVSPRRWSRGNARPQLARAQVGTTISVRLSRAARVSLTFRRARPGRRVRGRCVRPTPRSRNRPRCTRHVTAGRYAFDGRSGLNRLRFQGRLTRSKRLPLGGYRLVVRASDAGGTSAPKTARFRIVRR
jgi:hypothetical protein